MIRVIDSRTSPIVATQDTLRSDIQQVIETGFETLGFQIVTDAAADRSMVTHIRLISYELQTKRAFSRAVFEVTCTAPSGKVFENIYRVEHEYGKRLFWRRQDVTQWVNEAVTHALMRVFLDERFHRFLTS